MKHYFLLLGSLLSLSSLLGSELLSRDFTLAGVLHVLPRLAGSGERAELLHLSGEFHGLGVLDLLGDDEGFDSLSLLSADSLDLVDVSDETLDVGLVAPKKTATEREKGK